MPDQRTNRNEVDMSPAAVDQRLREVAQLYRLGVSLQAAEVLGPVEEMRRAKAEEFGSGSVGKPREEEG